MATAVTRSRSTRNARGARRPTRRAAPAGAQRADALKLLKQDHQRVKELFERFERGNVASKERLAHTICEELKLHAALEEQIFYPAVREVIDDDKMMNEAEIEHSTAKDLIAQIEETSADDERFDALVKVLGEYIEHHVGEEEGEMFKKVKRSRLDLEALGEEMTEQKAKLAGSERPKRSESLSA